MKIIQNTSKTGVQVASENDLKNSSISIATDPLHYHLPPTRGPTTHHMAIFTST